MNEVRAKLMTKTHPTQRRAEVAAEFAEAQGNYDLAHEILNALALGQERELNALMQIRPQGDGEAMLVAA